MALSALSEASVGEFFQIGDFGLSRDLDDETYYISNGGKIPVKWTAPEVYTPDKNVSISFCCVPRLSTTRSTRQPVMCGVLGVSHMRYGVLDTNLSRKTRMLRFATQIKPAQKV